MQYGDLIYIRTWVTDNLFYDGHLLVYYSLASHPFCIHCLLIYYLLDCYFFEPLTPRYYHVLV